jgi:hypothetical protein
VVAVVPSGSLASLLDPAGIELPTDRTDEAGIVPTSPPGGVLAPLTTSAVVVVLTSSGFVAVPPIGLAVSGLLPCEVKALVSGCCVPRPFIPDIPDIGDPIGIIIGI